MDSALLFFPSVAACLGTAFVGDNSVELVPGFRPRAAIPEATSVLKILTRSSLLSPHLYVLPGLTHSVPSWAFPNVVRPHRYHSQQPPSQTLRAACACRLPSAASTQVLKCLDLRLLVASN